MQHLKKALIKTLSYADIFDYPLTEKQLWEFLMLENKDASVSYSNFLKTLKEIKNITKKGTYYFFVGRDALYNRRITRENISKKKLITAKKIAHVLSYIPTISLIAVSGSLAMQNAREADDIYFFIISFPGTVWITRFFVCMLLDMLHVRRKKENKAFKNSICCNMFLDGKTLTLPKEKQTLYTAHETVQIHVLFERDNTYQKFISANYWTKTFLPHAVISIKKKKTSGQESNIVLYHIEKVSKFLQEWYMEKKRTHEYITDTVLAFHPIDRETYIKNELEKRVKKYAV